MINLRRLALVASIATMGSVALSSQVQAQTANVDFGGTIEATCLVNSTTAGTLTNIINGTLDPLRLETDTVGNISVSCNAGVKFAVTGIEDNGSVFTTKTFDNIDVITAEVEDSSTANVATGSISPNGSGTNNLNEPGALQEGPITADNYRVKLSLQGNGDNTLPVGIYKIRVKVALTPQ
ncbi:hypothetical protein MEO40_24510 [Dolichospermum sp. ST_sed1]|nr:hypothetical protein [Dolichospermum sp. ST_sed1]MDD1428656.1 hypothetical protein [Dolichospermum sp. ST_sed9]MDD1434595.1 hypothetical protein [Dolichospermum sp. ST_sed6]MDD1437490.1 hypothetical protein [Dolichospermum sp. ST_sed10]MDD1457633.1 hypothetical protein [Dolichospermum sp. ST_sed7]MDD1462007.1 hypothetical protein [Dolichospermum sp. ST_sed2]